VRGDGAAASSPQKERHQLSERIRHEADARRCKRDSADLRVDHVGILVWRVGVLGLAAAAVEVS
jgi:hypothetical protein